MKMIVNDSFCAFKCLDFGLCLALAHPNWDVKKEMPLKLEFAVLWTFDQTTVYCFTVPASFKAF